MSDQIQDSLNRLESKLDLAVKDFGELKARIADIGAPNVQVELILAGMNSRLDLVDERLARIGDRLDLIRRDVVAEAHSALEITK